MSTCNCLLVRIDPKDISAATGNTLNPNNTVYIDIINGCDGNPINETITERGYYCYCVYPAEPVLCDMSGYSYNISEEPILLNPLDPLTIIEEIPIQIYYYQNDVLINAVFSSYYYSETECEENNQCCTVCNTVEYCISDTNNIQYDDTYVESGFHNGNPYWVGTENGLYIYYSIITTRWCLSDELDGDCFLFGKSPCTTTCPDLSSEFFNEGICVTTTTTTPICESFDFESIFNCEFEPTPTPTMTPSMTPSMTPTPSSTNVCGLLQVVATINSYSPTPTPTPTITPSSSGIIERPCTFYGDVTYNTINEDINCPISKQFQDCYNGTMYYTTNNITNPSGSGLTQFMVFKATVNGQTKCISYIGETPVVSGVDNITLQLGPFGFSNSGGCASCNEPPTFITARQVGQNVGIQVETSTGYWKYNHNNSDSTVFSNGFATATVTNVLGEFTIISCDAGGTPSGDVIQLDLQSNQLTSFYGNGLTGLTYLNLNFNQITSFIKTGLSSLTYLNLNSNYLTSFNGTGLSSLIYLALNNNLLTTFNGTGLSNLTQLFLYNNQLTTFNGTSLTSLTALDLQLNQLTSFNGTGLSSLTFLNLVGNKLTSFNGLGLSNLGILSLYSNQLTSINFTPLTSLNYLQIGRNPILPLVNDQILSNLVGNNISSGTLDIQGSPNLKRTSASDTDFNTLDNTLNWTIVGTYDIVP